jgi:outer membrane receptor for ferrienterochelin and colicin
LTTRRVAALVALGLALLGARRAYAEGVLASPSEEDLFREIPPVLSDTRTLRAPLDVPGEFTVITAQDIRSSGATTLIELLETVPSLEVMRVSRSDANVSARGFNPLVSTRTLVMIDGRSVYIDFTGVVLWESLNVSLAEIDRIEVIIGPGSVLYGANALLGVINIITKRPHELAEQQPQVLHAGLGPESGYASAVLARAGELDSIKLSATYRGYDDFRNDGSLYQRVEHDRHTTGHRVKQFQSTYEHLFDDGTLMSLAGGLTELDSAVTTQIGSLSVRNDIAHTKLNLEKGLWRFQTFLNLSDADLLTGGNVLPAPFPPALPIATREQTTAWDSELSRSHILGSHTLLWGLNFRRVTTRSEEYLGGREREGIYGLFLQDELELGDKLLLLGGVRLDDHPKAGFHVSPRASLVYRLSSESRLRLLWSRSFRNPTTFFTYGDLTIRSADPGIPGVRLIGNERLDGLAVDSYELGYRAQVGERAKLDATVYLNTLANFEDFVAVPALAAAVTVDNAERGRAWGSKLALELALGAATKAHASWHFQSVHGGTPSSSPPHKLLLGVRGPLTERLRYALDGRFVSHQDYQANAFDELPLGDTAIRSHFGVDGYLGYQLAPDLELGFRVRNLFHQVRTQFPIGDEIGTEALFTVRWEP